MSTRLLIAFSLAFTAPLAATELSGDRPDATEGASTLPVGSLQLEAGATFATTDAEDQLEVGEVLLRYGFAEAVELRLVAPSWIDDGTTTGWGDVTLGAKLALPTVWGASKTALLVGASLPTGSEPGEVLPELRLVGEWDLGATWGLGTNLGLALENEAGRRFSSGIATVVLGRDLGPRSGLFLEWAGASRNRPGGSAVHLFDAGVTYQVNPLLQLDARVGVELAGSAQSWTIGLGVVTRKDP